MRKLPDADPLGEGDLTQAGLLPGVGVQPCGLAGVTPGNQIG